ncbi:MAG TPA: DUF5131 family protein, partial [Deinococcales bacterium]|nr:DUF5131 family protein [Deinococcales bacterium]
MKNSRIAWTDHTWNPWIGCTKVSEGCRNCYAAAQDRRWGFDSWGPGRPRRLTRDAYWRQPLVWDREAEATGRRARVFCASLADVFDPEAPAGALSRVWDLVRLTRNLDWLILTKRPERIREGLPPDWGEGWPNVWLGVTVEDRDAAARVPLLLEVPARVRFLSCEPLLEPLDLWPYLSPSKGDKRVHWVIAGGETGHGARPMHPAWARFLRGQCGDA